MVRADTSPPRALPIPRCAALSPGASDVTVMGLLIKRMLFVFYFLFLYARLLKKIIQSRLVQPTTAAAAAALLVPLFSYRRRQ